MKAGIFLNVRTPEGDAEPNEYSIRLLPETPHEKKLLAVTFERWANEKSRNVSVWYEESTCGADTESLTLTIVQNDTPPGRIPGKMKKS